MSEAIKPTLTRRFLLGGLASASLSINSRPAKANATTDDPDFEDGRVIRDLLASEIHNAFPLYLVIKNPPTGKAVPMLRGSLEPAAFQDFASNLLDWGGDMYQTLVNGSGSVDQKAIFGLIHKTRCISEYFDAVSPFFGLESVNNVIVSTGDPVADILMRGVSTLERPFSQGPGVPPIAQSYLCFSLPLAAPELTVARNRAFKSFVLEVGDYDPDGIPDLKTAEQDRSGLKAALSSYYEDYQQAMLQVEETTARLAMVGSRKGRSIADDLDGALVRSIGIITEARELSSEVAGETTLVKVRRNISYSPPDERSAGVQLTLPRASAKAARSFAL